MSSNHSPPSVLMVANYPKGTGYAWWLMETFWKEIADAASTAGWQSMIAYPPDSTQGSHRQKPFDPDRLEAFLFAGSLWDILEIYRVVRRLNIRSVYLTDRPFRSWKYCWLKVAGVRSIVVHDHTPGDRPAISGIKGLAKRILNAVSWITADLCVSVSPLMRQRHLLNARIPPSRCVTVTNGIIVRDLVPNARKLLLEQFGLAEDSYMIGAVGRLDPYKRFDFAIQCIAQLAQEYPEKHPVLILLGDGSDRARLEGLAESLGPTCRVIFVGQVADAWLTLCGVDTVIHPSAGEGLSLSILEAMAAARPVVVPSLPSVAQTIDDGLTGLIYHDGDLDEAKKLLYDLSSNKMLRASIGQNARQNILKHYQLHSTLEDFSTIVIPALIPPKPS